MLNLLVHCLNRKIRDDRFKVYVRAASAQQVKQVFTKRLLLIHLFLLPNFIVL
jgi:hypothetical protein